MRQHRPLLLALLLSLTAHLIWLVDADWAWPWQDVASEADVRKRSAPTAVKRVRLALTAAPPVRTGVLQVYRVRPAPAATGTDARSVRQPPRAVAARAPRQQPAPADAVATDATTASTAPTAVPAPAPVIEPAPSFPVAVTAIQQARYMGFSLRLEQQWLMEGMNYLIRNEASKFGFTALISSEGAVSVDKGLQPSHYELRLNKALKHYADFDRAQGLLFHGKAGDRKQTPLVDDFQDMASLPFHVAVTYEGQEKRQLKVTSGSSVYDILLEVVSTEELVLPGGTLSTLHLKGQRVRLDGSAPPQSGYDIWLAPSLRNFPVRFSGPDSKGNLLEMSVLSLSFDGKPVFGKKLPRVPVSDTPDAPEALPSALLKRLDGGSEAATPAADPMPAVTPATTPVPVPDPDPGVMPAPTPSREPGPAPAEPATP